MLLARRCRHWRAHSKRSRPDNALSDAERLNAIITNDLLPLARKARSMEEGAARSQAIQGLPHALVLRSCSCLAHTRLHSLASVAAPLAALEQARQQLDAVTKDMDLTAAQSAQVKAAQKTNTVCIKLGAMVGSKKQNKQASVSRAMWARPSPALTQDVFTAAKNLTDLLGEMNALLGLTQGAADATTGELLFLWLCFLWLARLSQTSTTTTAAQRMQRARCCRPWTLPAPAPSPKTPCPNRCPNPARRRRWRPRSAAVLYPSLSISLYLNLSRSLQAAAPAVEYKTPAQRQLVSPDRGSVGAGFTALGAGLVLPLFLCFLSASTNCVQAPRSSRPSPSPRPRRVLTCCPSPIPSSRVGWCPLLRLHRPQAKNVAHCPRCARTGRAAGAVGARGHHRQQRAAAERRPQHPRADEGVQRAAQEEGCARALRASLLSSLMTATQGCFVQGCQDGPRAHHAEVAALLFSLSLLCITWLLCSNQLQNWSVQLKILTSVKASSGGGRDSGLRVTRPSLALNVLIRSPDKALISMTQQIQNGLRSAPGAVLKALLAM